MSKHWTDAGDFIPCTTASVTRAKRQRDREQADVIGLMLMRFDDAEDATAHNPELLAHYLRIGRLAKRLSERGHTGSAFELLGALVGAQAAAEAFSDEAQPSILYDGAERERWLAVFRAALTAWLEFHTTELGDE